MHDFNRWRLRRGRVPESVAASASKLPLWVGYSARKAPLPMRNSVSDLRFFL